MYIISMILFGLLGFEDIDIGLASVYHDKYLACPKYTYKYTGLDTCAHRSLPCGSVINIKRIDTGKTVQAVVADRGPFGICRPSNKNTRACGMGSIWSNG